MAISFLRARTLARHRGGNVARLIAYVSRTKIRDFENRTFDFEEKGGLIYSAIFVPDQQDKKDSPQKVRENRDPSRTELELFSAKIELAETRVNSRLAKELIIAIPAELNREQQIEVSRKFAEQLIEKYRVGIVAGLHKPPQDGDQRNTHLHLILTTREIDAKGDFGNKVRALDNKLELIKIKNLWQLTANQHLLEEQHIKFESKLEKGEPPVPHFGKEAIGFERRTGLKSWKRQNHEEYVKKFREAKEKIEELETKIINLKEAEKQAELRKQIEAEYQEKYRYFAATKKLINRYKNPKIGSDREGEIILGNEVIKYSELSNYSLDFLKGNYRETRAKIERDLGQRIGQLPPVTQRLLTLVPIQQLEDERLICLFDNVCGCENDWQREKERQQKETEEQLRKLNERIAKERQEQERQREIKRQIELARKRQEQERQAELERQSQEQKRQAELERQSQEQKRQQKLKRQQTPQELLIRQIELGLEELSKEKFEIFAAIKKLISCYENFAIGSAREEEIILNDQVLRFSELDNYSLEFLEETYTEVRTWIEADLKRRMINLQLDLVKLEEFSDQELLDLSAEIQPLENELNPTDFGLDSTDYELNPDSQPKKIHWKQKQEELEYD